MEDSKISARRFTEHEERVGGRLGSEETMRDDTAAQRMKQKQGSGAVTGV